MILELLGKLHPLIVHLPIGFLVLAFLLDTYALWKRRDEPASAVVKMSYAAGMLAAAVAVITGLVLADNGKFDPELLNMHKWLGIGTLFLTVVILLEKYRNWFDNRRKSYLFSIALIVLISVTGHFGGSLTHGPDYLTERSGSRAELPTLVPDSVVVYRDLIQPVLKRKCNHCHSQKHPGGGLITSTYAGLIKGGDNGPAIRASNVIESELVYRVSLPTNNDKYMPPRGNPLSHAEFEILKYWIETGADTSIRFDPETMSAELQRLLRRDFNLDYTVKPHYEIKPIDSLSDAQAQALINAGYVVESVADDINYLEVRWPGDTLSRLKADMLNEVAEHILFLDLSNTVFEDPRFGGLSGMTNALSMDLHSTNVSDSAMTNLSSLAYLKSINLYDSPLTIDGVSQVIAAPRLEKVYLWQTAVTPEALITLRDQHTHIQFIGESTLQIFADTTKEKAKE